MIVIRADGGSNIGYGHLVRSSAIATEFLDRGFKVAYATTTPEAVSEVCPPNVNIHVLSERDNPDPFVSWLNEISAEVVVADSYHVDTEYMRTVRGVIPVFAVVSDDTRFEFTADILINGNLYAKSLKYDFVDEPPICLFGPRYVLLREEVRTRAQTVSPTREHAQRVVITMGGSDVRNYTPTAMRAFDGIDVTVDVVVGPGVENTARVESTAAPVDADFVFHHNPDNFLELIAQADVAVSGCGSTTYELLALGTPFVGVVQAENQEPIATALDNGDLAEVLPMDTSVDRLQDTVDSLLSDHQRRVNLQSRGRDVVDGRGTVRVCDEILANATFH